MTDEDLTIIEHIDNLIEITEQKVELLRELRHAIKPQTFPAIFAPTREKVEVLRVSNRGQYRPGDPGTGIRLYAVRFPDGTEGIASAGELRTAEGKAWQCPPLLEVK